MRSLKVLSAVLIGVFTLMLAMAIGSVSSDTECTTCIKEVHTLALEESRSSQDLINCYELQGCITGGESYYIYTALPFHVPTHEDGAFRICPPGSTSEDDSICVYFVDIETILQIEEEDVSSLWGTSFSPFKPLYDGCLKCIQESGDTSCPD